MQTCFFAISGVLPREDAIAAIKHSIEKTYGKRGESVVRKNFAAVDASLENLHEVKVPQTITSKFDIRPAVAANAPEFVRNVEALMMIGDGDQVPVSAMPIDGTFPTGTTKWEKRNIALEIPVWDEQLCIQCGKCVMVCPHAVIRAKVYDPSFNHAPEGFQTAVPKWREFTELKYTLQVAPEDCTGCGLCVADLPGQEQERGQASRHQHGAAAGAAREVQRVLGLLPVDPRAVAREAVARPGEGRAIAGAAVRVLRRVHRLRRNALHLDHDPPVRRSRADRQRDRLLVDLRRQSADYAVHRERRRTRAGVVELAVRRQRRVRHGHAPGDRQAEPLCEGAGRAPGFDHWRRIWQSRSSMPINRPRKASSRSASA